MSTASHPRIDARLEFDLSDMPELLEPWRDKVNECLVGEEDSFEIATERGMIVEKDIRIPDQVVNLEVSQCDFLPREFRGEKFDVRWIAVLDLEASFEIAEALPRKYVAVYCVQQA